MIGNHAMGNVKENTVSLQKKVVELSNLEDAVLTVTRYQNLQNNSNSYAFIFYSSNYEVLQEIFLSWTENYLTRSDCNEADCLYYLIQKFGITADTFLIDAIQSFENIVDHTTDFAVKRRDFIEFEGMTQVTISHHYKKVNVAMNPDIYLIFGEANGFLIDTQIYEISFKESL